MYWTINKLKHNNINVRDKGHISGITPIKKKKKKSELHAINALCLNINILNPSKNNLPL